MLVTERNDYPNLWESTLPQSVFSLLHRHTYKRIYTNI